MSERSAEKDATCSCPNGPGHRHMWGPVECPPRNADNDRTTVVRIRMPRDRSFLYFRLDRTGWQVRVHAELIHRRYHSPKRVEVMRFGPPKKQGGGCDCTTLCSMGPTCPGGMLAGLSGSGCPRFLPPGEKWWVCEGPDHSNCDDGDHIPPEQP